jgi:hypothetical protein
MVEAELVNEAVKLGKTSQTSHHTKKKGKKQ